MFSEIWQPNSQLEYQFLKMNIPVKWDKKKLARKYLIKWILKEAKDSRAILAKKKCEELGKSWTKRRILKWSNNSVWRLPNSTNYLSIKTVKYTILYENYALSTNERVKKPKKIITHISVLHKFLTSIQEF